MDHTSLEAGKLEVLALENLKVLSTIATQQTLSYDFSTPIPLPVNYPVIIVSDTKALITADAYVRHVPEHEIPSELPSVEPETLAKWRQMIASSRTLDFSIQPEVSEVRGQCHESKFLLNFDLVAG